MKITKVRVARLKEKREGSKLLGYAQVWFDNVFSVKNITIINGTNGIFCAMPSKKKKTVKEGESAFDDVAFPVDKAFRKELEEAILDEYDRVMEDEGAAL